VNEENFRAPNLNDTITLSKRDPFCNQLKNRLLKRIGAPEYLKAKSDFSSSDYSPLMKKNSYVLIGNKNYSVIKEIGKGAFAKVYLITNKCQTYALKVN
jgi:hypothetical protein